MLRTARRGSVLILALGAALLPGSAVAQGPPTLTRPVNLTQADLDPFRTYGAPSLAVDPENPLNVAASFINIRSKSCGLMLSIDGGGTWRQTDSSPGMPSYPFCFSNTSKAAQTAVAFGRNHRIYYLLTGWDTQDGGLRLGNVSLLLGRSSDLGNHWDTTFVRDARGIQGDDIESNRPFTALAVDSTSAADDIIYAAWRQDHNVAQIPRPAQPMVAVSTDGGRHFATPVSAVGHAFENADLRRQAISATTTTLAPTTPTTAPAIAPPPPDAVANFGGGNPSVTVDSLGTIYVVWPSWTVNIAPRPEPGIFFSRSTDHGKTFDVSQIAPFKRGNPGDNTYKLIWSPKGGSQGSLHLIYELRDPDIAGHIDTVYRRSTDGGRTWSDPRSLADDDPKQLYGHLIPNISVAPDGRLDAVWWDTRSDPGIRGADVYQTSSTDSGLTWSKNLRVTDQTVDRKLGVFGNNFDISAPPAVASANALTVVAWDDTRNSAAGASPNAGFGGGVQDMYSTALQYKSLSTGASKPLKAVLAGVVGLLAVGVLLLIAALAARGRRDADRRAGPVPDSQALGSSPESADA